LRNKKWMNRLVTQLNYKDCPLQLLQSDDVFLLMLCEVIMIIEERVIMQMCLTLQVWTTDFVKHVDCLFYCLPILFSYFISKVEKRAKVQLEEAYAKLPLVTSVNESKVDCKQTRAWWWILHSTDTEHSLVACSYEHCNERFSCFGDVNAVSTGKQLPTFRRHWDSLTSVSTEQATRTSWSQLLEPHLAE
jgi:hypothetical protein